MSFFGEPYAQADRCAAAWLKALGGSAKKSRATTLILL